MSPSVFSLAQSSYVYGCVCVSAYGLYMLDVSGECVCVHTSVHASVLSLLCFSLEKKSSGNITPVRCYLFLCVSSPPSRGSGII